MTQRMWASLAVAVLIVAVSVVLTWWNEATRQTLRTTTQPDPGEFAYLVRRYRRRTQTNILIALVGIGIFIGSLISDKLTLIVFWVSVLLTVFWIFLLAMADALDTRLHYQGMSDHYAQQQELLRRELQEHIDPDQTDETEEA